MRICHIVRQYHPSIGGLESFVASLAHAQQQLGCACAIVTLDRMFEGGSGRLAPAETVAGLPVRRVPMVGVRRYFAPLLPAAALAGYDVLHVHALDGLFERVARLQPRPGQARIATTHGGIFHTKWLTPLKRAYFRAVLRPAAARYDAIVANSENDAALMRGLSAPVHIVPNGVEPLGDFTAQGRDLFYLGRLSRHKRVDRLIDALAEPALADARLHVVGPAWDVKPEELARHASARGVAERVMLHGQADSARLAEIARACALFVSASTYEGFGMALIEAMSVGLAPVAQPNASFSELIGKARLGALADFADPPAAAARVRATRDALTPAERAAARAFAARYDWPAHARATLAIYEAALAGAAAVRALA